MCKPFPNCIPLAALALVVATASAQQVPSTDSAGAARPTFAYAKGPVVAIDEAHQNTHTLTSPEFRGLAELLQRDGYRVRRLREAITRRSLTDIDLLLISGPGGWAGPDASLSDAEVADLIRWIQDGGSLLLMLDHMPAPRNGARIAASLGVRNWHNGYVMVDTPDSLPVGPIIFWRPDFFPPEAPAIGRTGPGRGLGYQGADAVLAKHPITEGRTTGERVHRVATFVGSAFQPPPGAEPLLTMPLRAVSLVPPETPGAVPVFTADTPRAPVGKWLQGAVMTMGRGRVALFGETGLFSGGPAADNRRFVLNLVQWLRGGS